MLLKDSENPNSRAEYFRERRWDKKHFSVLINREVVEALEEKLKMQKKTKVQWFIEKAYEEIGMDKVKEIEEILRDEIK